MYHPDMRVATAHEIDLAEKGWEAYREALPKGDELPDFEELPPPQRHALVAFVRAIREDDD